MLGYKLNFKECLSWLKWITPATKVDNMGTITTLSNENTATLETITNDNNGAIGWEFCKRECFLLRYL